MKTLHLATSDFLRAIETASRCAAHKATIPVLESVLMSRNGDGVMFSATDLDIRIDATILKLEGDVPDTVISAHRGIRGALRFGGGSTVSAEWPEPDDIEKSRRLRLVSGNLALNLGCGINPDDFPRELQIGGDPDFSATLGDAALRQIGKVAIAMSTEETRYYLNGIFLEKASTEWGYNAVATDGHRMHVATLQLPDAAGQFKSAIVPRDAVARILGIAAQAGNNPARLVVGTRRRSNTAPTGTAPEDPGAPLVGFHTTVKGLPITLTARTIDGTFPDYRRVIPTKISCRAECSAQELRRSLAAIEAGSDSKSRAVKLIFRGGCIKASAKWVSLGGEAEVSVPFRGTVPDESEIGFNSGYLIDAIAAAAKDDAVVLHFMGNGRIDASAPMLMTSPDGESTRAVLMPMRI